MTTEEIRAALPVFPAPPPADTQTWSIRIDGRCAGPRVLDQATASALPHTPLNLDFACEEGWRVPGLHWAGIALADLIRAAQPAPEARYLAVGAGDFVAMIPLDEPGLDGAILADTLDGAPLAWEHGGPWRLVMAGAACFQSVKWVDRLTFTVDATGETAEAIARTRISQTRV